MKINFFKIISFLRIKYFIDNIYLQISMTVQNILHLRRAVKAPSLYNHHSLNYYLLFSLDMQSVIINHTYLHLFLQ